MLDSLSILLKFRIEFFISSEDIREILKFSVAKFIFCISLEESQAVMVE